MERWLAMLEGTVIILCMLLALIPLTLTVRRVRRLWLKRESNGSHGPQLKPGAMRAIMSFAFVMIGANIGLAAGNALAPPVNPPWHGDHTDHRPLVLAFLGLLGAIGGGGGAYYLFWGRISPPKSGRYLPP